MHWIELILLISNIYIILFILRSILFEFLKLKVYFLLMIQRFKSDKVIEH